MIALFALGGTEIILILFVILLLFGSKKLPELARSIGQAKREFHRATQEVMDAAEKPKPPEAKG